ncbi:MAG: DUF5050 domain-containing protein [Oscillospiraceae bacterium]|nr:DUF5050 domain-containing protein [Oscillospiraceae bacterium]
MKKTSSLLLITVIILTLSSCTLKTNQDDNDSLPNYNTSGTVSEYSHENNHNHENISFEINIDGFIGLGAASGSKSIYNIDNIFNTAGVFESVGGIIYYTDFYSGKKLYKYENGGKTILLDERALHLVFYENELYYLKKTADDIFKDSALFLGDIYALNPDTMEQRLVLSGNIRHFVITDFGLFYSSLDGLVWADMNGETIKQFTNSLQGVWIYKDNLLIYDNENEEWFFINIYTEETVHFGSMNGVFYIWNDTMFLSGDDYRLETNLLEIDLTTGEMHIYPQKRMIYMTCVGDEIYVSDMINLYKLDRENYEYIPIEIDNGEEEYFLFFLAGLYTDEETLYSLIHYSLEQDIKIIEKLVRIVIDNNNNKAEVVFLD